MLGLAAEWADAHPDPTDPWDEEHQMPAVAWSAAAPFAAAIGRSTGAGDALADIVPSYWTVAVAEA